MYILSCHKKYLAVEVLSPADDEVSFPRRENIYDIYIAILMHI